MTVVETWQTEQQDDSAVDHRMLEQEFAHVRVLTGLSASAVYVIPAKGTSIGRLGGDCDVVIDDARMSRKHARIERSIAGWQLQDLGARNHGYIDGRGYGNHDRAPLADGAVVRLGDTLMVFRACPPVGDGRHDSTTFPGVAPPTVAVRKRIDTLAHGSGHVLIIGETGTGKERIAQAIGAARAPHPVITVNCAQLSRELGRSELFGHNRGAFTNANANKQGLVDIAGEGVLFLDEIGELAQDVQAELLRFLEDGSYRPLGATELRYSTVRVVAATHVDLDQAVLNGKFRRDLLARLRASNTPLEVPPLRDRRDDILGWSKLFLRECGAAYDGNPWSAGALECLMVYPWLSNLRELRSVVNEIVEQLPPAGAEGSDQRPIFPIAPEQVPVRVRNHRGNLRSPNGTPLPDEAAPPQPSEPTKRDIEDTLRQTQGNMRLASQQLGIDRRKLYRLCEKFAIERDEYRSDTNRDDEGA